jgi:DNA repair exonuclease SbcCD ATPase subunit
LTQSNGDPKGKKVIPYYINWKFWLALLLGIITVVTWAFLSFTPAEISKSILKIATDPATYVPLGIVAAGLAGVWSKVKEVMDKAEEKAASERARNTEIEKKADTAATVAVALSDRVDTTADRYTWLEKSMEAYGQMAHNLTDDLQQERAETKLVTVELKKQIQGLINQNKEQQSEIDRLKENHRREIAELKEQIRLMGLEKSGDKEKIIALETQVSLLKDRVRELEEREGKLSTENKHLKDQLRGRRTTDQLPALASGDLVRLDLVSEEGKGSHD